MVTILSVAFTSPTRIEHERMTSPLMCTEQAPHWATPQPYLVPVRPTCSRITQSRGVSASTCTSRVLPLMLSLGMCVLVGWTADLVVVVPLAGGRAAPRRSRRTGASIAHRSGPSYAGTARRACAQLPRHGRAREPGDQ